MNKNYNLNCNNTSGNSKNNRNNNEQDTSDKKKIKLRESIVILEKYAIPESLIINKQWSVEEKLLLHRGIQIHGKNALKLVNMFNGKKTLYDIENYLKIFQNNISHNTEVPSTSKQNTPKIKEINSKTISTKYKINTGKRKKNETIKNSNHILIKNRNSLEVKSIIPKKIDENILMKGIQINKEGLVVKINNNPSEESDVEVDIENDCDSNLNDKSTNNFPTSTQKIDSKIQSTNIIKQSSKIEVITKDKERENPPLKKGTINLRKRKKKFLNDGKGGCTVSHGNDGEIIETTIVNEDSPKTKTVRKKPVYLIYCKPQNQKYNVNLHITALLLMDFHAHSSLSEVMGLIGGFWDCDQKTLSIMHYEPCKNSASSTTHCDMCPVSQAASAERIHNLEMDLLGWFHSHPMFPPEPSQQDLDTQRSLQQWIGLGKPCVGIILTPFNAIRVQEQSDYRCMIVAKSKVDTVFMPYKLKVDVNYDNFDIDGFLVNVLRIYQFTSLNRCDNNDDDDNKQEIHFDKPFFLDKNITYMNKFIKSAKMTLEKYFPDEKFCESILKGIEQICKNENI